MTQKTLPKGTERGRTFRLTLVCAVLPLFVAIAGGGGGVNSSSYVRRGLVAHWDAIDNVGVGVHDASATTWKDLTGNGFDWTLTDGYYTWTEKAITLNGASYSENCSVVGANAKKNSDFNGKMKTVEFIYRATEQGDTVVFSPGYDDRKGGILTLNTGYLIFFDPKEDAQGIPLELNATNVYRVVYTMGTARPTALEAVYKNGQQVAPVSTGSWLGQMTEVTLGGRVTTWTKPARGELMSIRIYSTELTPNEVAVNAALDQIRFFGADPKDVMLPEGFSLDADGNVIKAHAVGTSVFDDVKVWYKGSVGNAVGTSDVGGAAEWSDYSVCKLKPLTGAAWGSDAALYAGGSYFWWGWRMRYDNVPVKLPYANLDLGESPCMVFPAPVTTNGWVDVEIDGEMMSRPVVSYRVGGLKFPSWLPDWPADAVCSNYTCVLRFKPGEAINPVSGGNNAMHLLHLGSIYQSGDKPSGLSLCLNTLDTLSDRFVLRSFIGDQQRNFEGHKIRQDRWVDLAIIADGPKLTWHLCYEDGEDGATTNVVYTYTETFGPTVAKPCIPANRRVFGFGSNGSNFYSATFTNGVSATSTINADFRGVFNQVAFWDRTLSTPEVQEAMGRPALVNIGQTGNEGNVEFLATKTRVTAEGDWESLNPVLTAANPSATIDFTCPQEWDGLPQFLRVTACADSDAGEVEVRLNGDALGTLALRPGKATRLYVPAKKIATGANALVLAHVSGMTLKLDAVSLAGSWSYGRDVASEGIGCFGYDRTTLDSYNLSPSCGNGKFNIRGITADTSARAAYIMSFRLPEDMADCCKGVLRFRIQNTGGNTYPATVSMNGRLLDTLQVKGGGVHDIKAPHELFRAGWNAVELRVMSGWANVDCLRLTVKPYNAFGHCIYIR